MRYLTRAGVCLMVALAPMHADARQALTDPYAIFDRARTYWDTASYPSSVSYEIAVGVTRRSVVSMAHYHAYYAAGSDKVWVDAVSDEERAHPYVPHGINTSINLFGGSIPVSAPQHTFDYLGVPQLAPNYSFDIARVKQHTQAVNSADLVKEIRRQFNDPQPSRRQPERNTGLKTIASVAVTHRHYAITLVGMNAIDGHVDYDLQLKPISNPSQYRLRELWINANTFATDQLVTEGNFTSGQLAAVRWTIVFQQVDGAPYIESEQAQSGFILDRRAYDSASITFTRIAAHDVPPLVSLWTFASRSDSAPEVLAEPGPANL